MHEEAGTFTLLPGARGFHGLFGARADPVRYRAVRAVIGLHMRRHLRYFTPVFSVAFETQKFWHFSYLQVLKLTSPHTLERDRDLPTMSWTLTVSSNPIKLDSLI